MTKKTRWILGGITLMLAFAALLIFHHAPALLLLAGEGLLFGIVVTYTDPPTGTFAPTIAQVRAQSMVTALVNMGDTDTTTTVTHSFNASAADQKLQFPLTLVQVQTPGTAIPTFAVGAPSTNTVVISKLSAAGSGGTYLVVILRPHTIIR